MHAGLQKEVETYEKRTPKSKDAHKRAEGRLPLGVASNYRAYDPLSDICARWKGRANSRHRRKRISRFQFVLWSVDGGALPSGGGESGAGEAGHGNDVRDAARFGMGTGGRNL